MKTVRHAICGPVENQRELLFIIDRKRRTEVFDVYLTVAHQTRLGYGDIIAVGNELSVTPFGDPQSVNRGACRCRKLLVKLRGGTRPT